MIVGVTGDLVDAMVGYVKRIDYVAFFGEVVKRNSLKCCFFLWFCEGIGALISPRQGSVFRSIGSA